MCPENIFQSYIVASLAHQASNTLNYVTAPNQWASSINTKIQEAASTAVRSTLALSLTKGMLNLKLF